MRLTGTFLSEQFVLGVAISFLLTTSWLTMGCAIAGDSVLPAPLENRVTSNGTADDHVAAAMLYQRESQRLQAEASKYEQTAAAIGPLEDPKGFRRSGLIQTAESLRAKAAEMQQLYAAHQKKAESMTGMKQRQ